MNKYVLGIDGMRCGMCEMHVEETFRKAIKVKKVKASHIKNNVILFSIEELTPTDFENILKPTGYRLLSYRKEIATKGLLGWK